MPGKPVTTKEVENIVSRMDEGVLCDEHGKPYPEVGQLLFRSMFREPPSQLARMKEIFMRQQAERTKKGE